MDSSVVLDKTTLVVETEICFASNFNTTVSGALDSFFTASQDSNTVSQPFTNASCSIQDLPATYPAVNPFLSRVEANIQFQVKTDAISSGLFGFYKCTTSMKFLSEKFDPDQDGKMGIQCKSGVWDLNPNTMPTVVDCIEETVCGVDTILPKVQTGLFRTPLVSRIAKQEFLYLTCKDPESYLYQSKEHLPAIFTLVCQNSGTMLPWKTSPAGVQGPDTTNSWPSCKTPNYCTNFPVSPTPPSTTTTTTAASVRYLNIYIILWRCKFNAIFVVIKLGL